MLTVVPVAKRNSSPNDYILLDVLSIIILRGQPKGKHTIRIPQMEKDH